MADRKHGENRQRDRQICIRVSGAELAALTVAAGRRRTSVPDLLRTAGLVAAGALPIPVPDHRGTTPGTARTLDDCNGARSQHAAQRDVDVARRALETAPHPDWPPLLGAVAKARVDLPDATLAEVGARIGVSKNSAASAMRRLRAAMEAQRA